jgi:fructose/tagatose bisphosphate aldolase
VFSLNIQIMTQVRNYVTGSSKFPFILHGESGCGKTSFVAKAYSQVETSAMHFSVVFDVNIALLNLEVGAFLLMT